METYRFDEKTNTLFMSKLPIDTEFHGYRVSDHYKAFTDYLYKGGTTDLTVLSLDNDLRLLANALESRWSARTGEEGAKVEFIITDIIEEDYNWSNNAAYPMTTVLGKIKFHNRLTKEFPLLSLPSIDRFGTCNYGNNFYTFAATSEPSKYITFDGNKELNIMLNARKVSVIYDKGKVRFEFGKDGNQKLKATTLCYIISLLNNDLANPNLDIQDIFTSPGRDPLAFCEDRSYTAIRPDITELLQQIRTSDNIKWLFENEDDLEYYEYYSDDEKSFTTQLNYPKSLLGMFGIVENADNGVSPDKLYEVRTQLNELLSIDRGLDRRLSRDVYDPRSGAIIARSGALVNAKMLNLFHRSHVNCYYVRNYEAMSGNSVLAVDIAITKLCSGSYIPERVRDDNKALLAGIPDIVDRDYEFNDPMRLPIIKAGTSINTNILELIANSELSAEPKTPVYATDGETQLSLPSNVGRVYYSNTYIPIREDSNKEKFKLSDVVFVSLEEEILGNRHFKVGSGWKFVKDVRDGLEELPPSEYLTVYDILALMSIMPRLKSEYIDLVSDRDMGMRKRYCLVDDHIHKAFKVGMGEIVNKLNNNTFSKFDEICENADILADNFRVITRTVIKKLGSNDLKVMMLADTTNPASLTAFMNRILTNVGSKHGVSDSMRLLALGFYGRICPYETPASAKLGLTNTKAIHAEIKNGDIYTPYYQLIRTPTGRRVDTNPSNVKYLRVIDEEKKVIASIMSLELDENMNILNLDDYVVAKVPSNNGLEKMEIQNVSVKEIDYVTVYPDQSLSPTATLIPYIGSNDSTRVTYGLNMARQTRPLVYREIPLVYTKGNIDIVRSSTYFQITAEASGTVTSISYQNFDGIANDTKYTIIVTYDEPVMWYNDKMTKYRKKPDACVVTYTGKLVEYNHSSVVERKVEVREGDRVKRGDIIMSSNYTLNGIYATGVNALVGVVPIGYNYEDGVQIADRLAEKYTSYGHTSETYSVRSTSSFNDVPHYPYIYNNNTRLYKLSEVERSDDPYIMSRELRGYIVKRSSKTRKKVGLTRPYTVNTIYLSKMHDGDKNANRHGNKGVVPSILPNSKMLYLENGEFLDLCYNPAGFASRMNIGQLKELAVALAAKVLGIHICVQSFNELEWEDQVKILDYAWICANKGVDVANSDARFAKYPASFKAYVKSRERNIKMWKGVFYDDGSAILTDPKTGHKLHGPVVVGVNYVTKLVQEVDEKAHSRGGMLSDSRYDENDGRPTQGASRGGGQTIGTMELNALMSYNVPNYIYEIMHERGDDPVARQLMTMKLLGTDEVMREEDLNILKHSSCRRSVTKFVNMMAGLGVEVEIDDPEQGIIDVNNVDPDEQFIYSTGAVIGTVVPTLNRDEDERSKKVQEDNLDALGDILGIK